MANTACFIIVSRNDIPIYEAEVGSDQKEQVHLLHFGACQYFRKGSKSGASGRCSGCQGSGMKVSIRQLGPGMSQQMQHVCPECRGSGEVISDKDRCGQCKGEKVLPEKKVLEVHVDKGMQHGQKIVFQGEADEAVFYAVGGCQEEADVYISMFQNYLNLVLSSEPIA